MKLLRLISSALLATMLAATTASAQAEWQITSFQSFSRGFSGVLRFRNVQGYGTAPILAITGFGVTASANAQAACRPPSLTCNGFAGWGLANFSTTGAVQTGRFVDNIGTPWIGAVGGWNGSSPNAGGPTFFMRLSAESFEVGPSVGVLGCQTPATPNAIVRGYAIRTCMDDGLDGWFNFFFSYTVNTEGNTFTAADVIPNFTVTQFQSVNGYVPEPSSYALLATGLAGLALLRRRRPRRQS